MITNKQNWLLVCVASVAIVFALPVWADEAKILSEKIISFKSDCEGIPNLKSVDRRSLRSVCAERKEIPIVVMGDEEFLFPEAVIESLSLTKSYGEKYGSNQCPAPIRACYAELLTEFGKLEIIIASNNNRMPSPFERLKKHSFADNTMFMPDRLRKDFADKLNEKPVKMESPTNGEFFVNKIITDYEGSPPITDDIYNAVVYVISQPNNSNNLIISCSGEPKSDPLNRRLIMCRRWYPLNDYTYYSYMWKEDGLDEIAFFDEFKQAEKIINSYRVQPQPDAKKPLISPQKE